MSCLTTLTSLSHSSLFLTSHSCWRRKVPLTTYCISGKQAKQQSTRVGEDAPGSRSIMRTSHAGAEKSTIYFLTYPRDSLKPVLSRSIRLCPRVSSAVHQFSQAVKPERWLLSTILTHELKMTATLAR